MRTRYVPAFCFAVLLGGCAVGTDEAPAGADESEVIGDSAEAIMTKLVGQGLQQGVSDENTSCGMRVLSDADGPLLQWNYQSTDEGDYANGVRAHEFKVALISRKMMVRHRYGDSYLFPCTWGGSKCDEDETTVEYDDDRRITKISTVLNDAPKGSCSFSVK